MAGVWLASTDGAGWTLETVDLELTGRLRAAQQPLGNGPQLPVIRHGHLVAYCADLDAVEALGVDISQMAVAARWLLE